MDDLYRVSPAWAARTRFTGASGALHLEPIDLAVLLLVAGRVADTSPGEDGDVEQFVAAMREQRDLGDTHASPISVDVRASDLALRLPLFAKVVERLRHSRNRDERCFTSIVMHPDGKGAAFEIACGVAMLTAHRVFAAKSKPEPGRPGPRVTTPFANRAFVDVRPSVFAGFRSVSSAPVALRLMSWLHARSPEGLPPDHRCEVDEHERWLIRATHDNVARTLGITSTRASLGYYNDLMPRIAADLLPLGFRFRAVAEPVHRRATNWRIRFHRIDRFVDPSPSRDDDLDRDDDEGGGESLAMLQRIVDSRHVPDEPEPVAADNDDVEPVATVAAPEQVVRPRMQPRPRMTGIAIVEPDDVIVPEPIAKVVEPVVAAPAPLPVDRGENALKPMAPPVMPTLPRPVLDARPPWLRRRFVYSYPLLPDAYSDRPLSTHIECEDAFRVGVHIWIDGMGAQPERLQGLSVMEGYKAVVDLQTYAWMRQEWIRFFSDYPDREWTGDDTNDFRPHPDDDPEADLPAHARSIPRDPENDAARPHDGIGWVDEEGNPVDDEGVLVDRTEAEQEWNDLVPVPVDVT